jgi:hypothetical protein
VPTNEVGLRLEELQKEREIKFELHPARRLRRNLRLKVFDDASRARVCMADRELTSAESEKVL